MTPASPVPMSARYGARSFASIVASVAVVDRHLVVRVGAHVAVPGKCFPTAPMPTAPQAATSAAGERRHGGSGPSGTRGRRSRSIEPKSMSSTGAKLKSTPCARSSDASTTPTRARQVLRERRVRVVEPAERAHRRQPREAVREPLDPAALVIDGDQQRGRSAPRGWRRSAPRAARATGNCVRTGSRRRPADARAARARSARKLEPGDVDHHRPERRSLKRHRSLLRGRRTPPPCRARPSG